jgi:hypothetical protein
MPVLRTIVATLILIACSFPGARAAVSFEIYNGGLRNGFANYYSWAASYDLNNATVVRRAGSRSIRFKPDNWGGVRVISGGGGATRYPVADYGSLTFWVNGAGASGQKVNVSLQFINTTTNETVDLGGLDIGAHTPAGRITGAGWQPVTVNFDVKGLTYGKFNGLVFSGFNWPNATQPNVYIADITVAARTVPVGNGGAVNVSVNTTLKGRSIDPLIFGVAFGDSARNAKMGYTMRRWGGNSTTRYNWQVDVRNTGSDWYFENTPGSTDRTTVPPIGNAADKFISDALAAGGQPLITIPTIGFTPRRDSPVVHPFFAGFSVSKYGAQSSTDSQWDPNAGNGIRLNGTPITGNTPADTSIAVGPAFMKAWIAHFQAKFGTAANGGVTYYALDNEPMLWNSTHRDVHPAAPTQAEILGKALAYGAAIKQQDPNARVTGPVTWGFCDLFWSASDNCGKSSADRNANGGLPFVAWYLQQICSHPLVGGKRAVDVLDLHWYPQGEGISLSGDDSPATAKRRLSSLRELNDPNWVSESWLADLGDTDLNHYSKPNLLRRSRSWIAQYCAGTKLAITEYNWGQDDTVSGAVAQAELLAIYASEGVDMATRWGTPAAGTVVENAFSLYLNYDGAGAKVQGASTRAVSANLNKVGVYAFQQATTRTFIVLTNKEAVTHDVTVTFNAARSGLWKLYGFDGTANLAQRASGTASGAAIALTGLKPMSAYLLVVPGT